MSTAAQELWQLLERARAGDGDAAAALHLRYEGHIRRVVRRRLPDVLRVQFDSTDFVQSVWGEFFNELTRGTRAFQSPEHLVRFLQAITRNRVTTEVRRRLETTKHEITRTVPLNDELMLASSEPSPSEVAVEKETFEQMLRDQPEMHQNVLRLRAAGFTFREIAARTGINERSARRILARVVQRMGFEHAS